MLAIVRGPMKNDPRALFLLSVLWSEWACRAPPDPIPEGILHLSVGPASAVVAYRAQDAEQAIWQGERVAQRTGAGLVLVRSVGEMVGEVHREFFADIRPASTMIEVSRFIDPEWLVEIEADAFINSEAPRDLGGGA